MTNTDQLRARDAEAEMEQHHAVDEKQVAALSTSASILGPRPKRLGFPSLGPQVLTTTTTPLSSPRRSHPPLSPFPSLSIIPLPHHFTICAGVPGNSAPSLSVFLFTTGGGVFLIGRRRGSQMVCIMYTPRVGITSVLCWSGFAVAATFVVWLIRAFHAGLAGGGFG